MDLSAVIKHFDVLPSDNRDLRDPATQQIRALDQDVIALGVAIEVSRSGDGCEQQADAQQERRDPDRVRFPSSFILLSFVMSLAHGFTRGGHRRASPFPLNAGREPRSGRRRPPSCLLRETANLRWAGGAPVLATSL